LIAAINIIYSEYFQYKIIKTLRQ